MFANGTYVLAEYRRGQGVLSVNSVRIASKARHSTRTKRHREHGLPVLKNTRRLIKMFEIIR